VGKACESNPIRSAANDAWVNSEKYEEIVAEREEDLRQQEIDLDRKAAKKAREEGRPYVTLAQAEHMWKETANK
jgi:hypothetical protein